MLPGVVAVDDGRSAVVGEVERGPNRIHQIRDGVGDQVSAWAGDAHLRRRERSASRPSIRPAALADAKVDMAEIMSIRTDGYITLFGDTRHPNCGNSSSSAG